MENLPQEQRKQRLIQSKPSEKGEIIPSLSRMGDVLDDIEKRSKIAVLLVCAVYAVIDSNKPHAFLHKQDFRIKADFQIITPQTGHILDYQRRYFSVFYLLNEFAPTRTIEVRTRIPVVHKEREIFEAVFLCVFT